MAAGDAKGAQGSTGSTTSGQSGGTVLPGENSYGGGGSGSGAGYAGPTGPSSGATSFNAYTLVPTDITAGLKGYDGKPLPPIQLVYYAADGTPSRPATGRELWYAINSLTDIYKQTGSQQYLQSIDSTTLETIKNRLKTAYFPTGFTGTGTDANKIFGAVTTKLGMNLYDLQGLTAPTLADYAGSRTATQIRLLQQQKNQLTAAVNNASITQESNAFAAIQNYLEQWNLTDLSRDFYNIITKAGDHVINTDALLNIMRGAGTTGNKAEDARLQGAYNQRFAGLTEYNKNPNNTVKMTESAYQQYTAAIQETSGNYGLPAPTQQEIGKLLNGNVNAPEFATRVKDIYSVISNADQNTKNILSQQYGISTSDLFKYMTTGSVPERQRQVASASIQDYAQRVGLTGVGKAQGEELAQMAKLAGVPGNQGLGYGINQIEQSLLGASKDVALTTGGMPGANVPTVDTKTLIGAQLAGFGGTTQVQAQTQVARAEQARVAPFEKGGGYAETSQGVVGLGSARS